MPNLLLYLGAGLPLLWGIAHLFPTKSVVADFGPISVDNRRIITMEWVAEGVALVALGAIVATITSIDPHHAVARAVYLLCAATLTLLALVSLFTGFRIRFLPFRLCPLVFTTAAVLIVVGSLM